MTGTLEPRAMGQPLARLDGPAKVTGTAPYAYEHPLAEPVYAHLVLSTIARGRIVAVDAAAAEALDGVVGVLTHENAPRLVDIDDPELWILQSPDVHFRGQIVGAVLAETPEVARHGASLVRIEYESTPAELVFSPDRADLYVPDVLNAGYPTESLRGDPDRALAEAAVTVDATYTTPMLHHTPMEPHTAVARWEGGALVMYDSTQGAHSVRAVISTLVGIDTEQVTVVSPYVGGGFGSKGMPHAHNALAALAARTTNGRPVKLALTRQQMFSLTGYRTPTVQRVRLGADSEGRLVATTHDVVELTSRIKEFAEQTAIATRIMYATPNLRTSHRLAPLDLPVPTWMRAPGECPGMFALEVAMDELAYACGLDPIELRIRNEPEVEPESGRPWSSRNLVACLREGARRFGWARRDPTPGVRREGPWLVGTGVASSTYPTYRLPGSAAMIRRERGRYVVSIGAADIGTGTWTTLTQIAADALGVSPDNVALRIGDTDYPAATVAGGSSGTTSWGSAIVAAASAFRDKFGSEPPDDATVEVGTPDNPDAERFAMHAFGAQFAEVRVHVDTGEVRVPRMLGVFAAGRIINPRTARSQFIGGMTMGLSMALYEQGVLDPRFGHVVNHDLAEYHVAAAADVVDIDAVWVEEHDPYVNPMGSKGIGEIGIVGAAAAVANAAYHATGIRVRDLPLTLDRFLR